jgi:hypothetical protein
VPAQHEPVSTQAWPAGHVALLVQGVKVAQLNPLAETQTTLPSVLRSQPQLGPHATAEPPGHNCVVLAGQMLTGKQEPA